jgi:hypothetical protein
MKIAREAIRNAFRHAAASRIEAGIACVSAMTGSASKRKSWRGASAQDTGACAESVNGRSEIGANLDFCSEVGAGTEVELTVPARLPIPADERIGWLSQNAAYSPARSSNGRPGAGTLPRLLIMTFGAFWAVVRQNSGRL